MIVNVYDDMVVFERHEVGEGGKLDRCPAVVWPGRQRGDHIAPQVEQVLDLIGPGNEVVRLENIEEALRPIVGKAPLGVAHEPFDRPVGKVVVIGHVGHMAVQVLGERPHRFLPELPHI